jgi:hypothetical protein
MAAFSKPAHPAARGCMSEHLIHALEQIEL